MLCKTCIDVLEEWDGVRYVNHHHLTMDSLDASVAEGCYFCSTLWHGLSRVDQDRLRKNYPCPVTCFETYARPGLGRVSVNLEVVLKGPVSARCRYILSPTSVARAHENNLCSWDTGSDESWDKAKAWLGNCLKHHPLCYRPVDTSWYPTRLLDTNKNEGSMDTVRLVATATHEMRGPYLTLSHCWGGSLPLCLLRSNMQEFESGIPLSALPKTFSDAVTAARKLKVRYLWIDSLCIMQDKDDLSDWQRESSLMEKVYSNSYCNISASAANNSSGGLFFSRDPRREQIEHVNLCSRSRADGLPGQTCNIVDAELWEHNVMDSPLNHRGWVLQERLLAPRVLHFGRKQLFWECSKLDASESLPDGLPETDTDAFKYFGKVPRNFKRMLPFSIGPGSQMPETFSWIDIVQMYTRTRLTNVGDRLIALSGVAKRVRTLLNDEYLAGIWRNGLAVQLSWSVVDPPPSNPRERYIAPTWSWASVCAPVTWDWRDDGTYLIALKSVHLDYATKDTTGAVTGGYLDVRGHLSAAKDIQMFEDGQKLSMSFSVPVLTPNGTDQNSLQDCWICPDSFDFPAPQHDVAAFYCMPIANLSVLVLELCDAERRIFRRCGCGTWVADRKRRMQFVARIKEQLIQPDEPKGPQPGWIIPDGVQTIRII